MSISTTHRPSLTNPPPPATPTPSNPTNSFSQSLSNIGLGYAIAIAFGFLVLFSTLILSSYLCCRSYRHHQQRNSHPPPPSDGGIILPRIIFVADDEEDDPENRDFSNGVVGLDQPVINSYPNFPFSKKREDIDNSKNDGDNGSNSTCSICLCDYKDGEMLRMMPDCKHFFHLCCLDAWLRLNGSCPVCRNSPLPTPLSTPLAEVVPLSHYPDNRRRS